MPLPTLVDRLRALYIPSEGMIQICIKLLNQTRITLRQCNQKIASLQGRIRQLKYNSHQNDYDNSSLPDILASEQMQFEDWQEKLQRAEKDFSFAIKATTGVCYDAEKTWELFISISHYDAEHIYRFAIAYESETRKYMLTKALSIFGKQLTSSESWSFINDNSSAYWYAKAQNDLSIELGGILAVRLVSEFPHSSVICVNELKRHLLEYVI
ncbi:hypothetical protein [Enterobacter asburiae]|uniref:hypothetical protein n=1 Tax=Enterobacter asburiae TaxID=61645 RepID=UPI0009495C11|nr:hypothetical protein [Enterobacter asburiae]MEA1020472.1 hypothetical protein [Enterobacter asburiae]